MIRSLLLLLVCACLATPAWAAAPAPARPRRSLEAVRAHVAPVIDGRLDDAVWRRAPAATGFVQQTPDDGKPATFHTVVRIAFDAKYLYVAARMYDPHPKLIRRTLSRRDVDPDSDTFAIAIDGFHDRRTAAAFFVTAANVQRDMQLYDDTNGDDRWNAVWKSAVTIDDKGWCAEIAIPLSQLRFNGGEKRWGLELLRLVARTGEQDRWQPIPRGAGIEVSGYGNLTGVASLEPKPHLELVPYASTTGHLYRPSDAGDPFHTGHDLALSAGLDVKYGLSSDWTLDATFNPDFGQVEADPAQVNLSDTQLYLLERRPFFLDGVQIFGTGDSGATSLFYTRRIGSTPLGTAAPSPDAVYSGTPTETPILGAAKLTGHTKGGTSVGVLEALTSEVSVPRIDARGAPLLPTPGDVIMPFTSYLVLRGQQDLGKGSSQVGLMATAVNRSLTDNLAGQLTRSAYAGGADWNLGFDHKHYYVLGHLYGSVVQGRPEVITGLQTNFARYMQRPDASYLSVDKKATSMSGASGEIRFGHQGGPHFDWDTRFGFTTPSFEVNDLGFLNRADEMYVQGSAVVKDTKAKGALQSWDAGLEVFGATNMGGDIIGGEIGAFGDLVTRGFVPVSVWMGVNPSAISDRLLRGGPRATAPAVYGYYVSVGTDQRRRTRLTAHTQGWISNPSRGYVNASLTLTAQPLPALSLSLTPTLAFQKSDAQYVGAYTDPAATATYGTRYVFAKLDQATTTLEGRVDWSFSPSLTLQTYVRGTLVTGAYRHLAYFTKPMTRDFAPYAGSTGSQSESAGTFTVQAAGSQASYSFDAPSFAFTGLQVNAVLRWEWRPGSTLFAVYQLGCGGGVPTDGLYRFADWGHLCRGGRPEHSVEIKVSYWFSG